MPLNRTILKQAMKAGIVFDIKTKEILYLKNMFSRKVDFKMNNSALCSLKIGKTIRICPPLLLSSISLNPWFNFISTTDKDNVFT